jgi:dihydrofolate reductase
MNFFKKKTLGSTVIMGRKNYLSIPEKYRPLPNRYNIVLTRDKSFIAKDCLVLDKLEDAIKVGEKRQKEIFIIGGGQLYNYAIENDLVDIIYLTRIHAIIDGDTFFPELKKSDWNIINESRYNKDHKHQYDFTFLTLEKVT